MAGRLIRLAFVCAFLLTCATKQEFVEMEGDRANIVIAGISAIAVESAAIAAAAVTEAPPDTEEAVAEMAPQISPEAEAAMKVVIVNEVRNFVSTLNRTIRAEKYRAWLGFLDESYFELISSPEFLSEASQADRFKKIGLVLEKPEDYFNYVVVPSRNNLRVDEIEIESPDIVRVYAIMNKQRLLIYKLKSDGANWKIIN
jgi:hypothetical protein